MIKLYEIDAEIDFIINRLLDEDLNEGEKDIILAELEQLTMEKQLIIQNVGLTFKESMLFLDAMKEEKKRLSERINIYEERLKKVKEFLARFIGEGNKLKLPQLEISWRKSSSIEEDYDFSFDYVQEHFPDLIRIKLELDKQKAKEFLKGGVGIKGLKLKEKNNIQIK